MDLSGFEPVEGTNVGQVLLGPGKFDCYDTNECADSNACHVLSEICINNQGIIIILFCRLIYF